MPRAPGESNLVIYAGMPRTGSTYLFTILQRHPQVFLPPLKELNQFLSVNYSAGSLATYAEHFGSVPDAQVAFDISPPYFLEPASAQRILDEAPNAKVVLCVRDPIDYAISFYHQFRSLDAQVCSFEDFLDGRYFFDKFDFHIRFDDNFVVDAVTTFRDLFGARILLVSFDYYRRDFSLLLAAIERFAGIDPFFSRENLIPYKINASARPSIAGLNKLLFRPAIKKWVARRLSRNLVHRLGQTYNRVTAVRRDHRYANEEERRLAAERLAPQSERLKRMFRSSPILLG